MNLPNVMIKRFLYILTCFIIFFAQISLAQEVYTITSVNFDTSNSILFLTSPDTSSASAAASDKFKNIKLNKLDEPKRIYFDLEGAKLTLPQQNWYLNSGSIKQVRVSQFSTNPDKVRVVFYTEDNFNPSQFSLYKINNNIVIKFKNEPICREDYFQTVYKDDKVSSSEFYENLSISNEEFSNLNSAVKSASQEDVISQIQNSFNSKAVAENAKEVISKDLRLKSRYYLNSITLKENGILLSGFGALTLERPMILTSPSRIVYDIPNSIINPALNNKVFKNAQQETIKVAQYNQNKARLVITTEDTEKYMPAFSPDTQSVFFTKDSVQNIKTLINKTNDIISYNMSKSGNNTHELTLAFNSPLVLGIKRSNTSLTVFLCNTLRFSEEKLLNITENTAFEDMKTELLPKVGLKLTIPVDKNYISCCEEGADGKAIKISIKGNLGKNKDSKIQMPKINPASPFKRSKGNKNVVLDAGHGGTDYGAIREGINEKDINLDMVLRVESILKNKGVKVYLTRNTDEYLTLQQRCDITEIVAPQIFVSVHVNSSTKPEIYGIETHYYHENSLELANIIHSHITGAVNSKDRGIFKSKFYVINHTSVPAVLLEIGFISNSDERAELLSEKRKQATAKAIAEGIIKYLNEN